MYLSKKQIKKIILNQKTSIRNAIQNMNKSGLKIVLAVDEKKSLSGIVVDGDIRRGLIKNLNLNSPIKNIVSRNPKVIKKKISDAEALEYMKSNNLIHLPLIDGKNIPSGLYTYKKDSNITKINNQFIIMAGGKGTRLYPVTKTKPKALVKVYGRPMLEHIISNAKSCGFNNFTISIKHFGNKIKKYFQNGKKLNTKIEYLTENKPLGTAGSLYKFAKKKNQTVVVSNCDVISDLDYSDVLKYHKKNKALATMVVIQHENTNPYGVVTAKGNRFLGYLEKPLRIERINAGIYVFETKVFKFIQKNKYLDMNIFFSNLLKQKKKIIVYPIYEKWQDFGQKKIKF